MIALPMLGRIGFKKLEIVLLTHLMFLHFCWIILCKRVQSQTAGVLLLVVDELRLARAVGLSYGRLHRRRCVVWLLVWAMSATGERLVVSYG